MVKPEGGPKYTRQQAVRAVDEVLMSVRKHKERADKIARTEKLNNRIAETERDDWNKKMELKYKLN